MKIEPNILDIPKVMFNLYRTELALASEIITPGKYFGTPDDGIDWKSISKMTDYFGFWSNEPKDPIWYLLAHSDKDGIITNKQLEVLIPRLTELNKILPGAETVPNWKKFNTEFLVGLSTAYVSKDDITFK